jgi:hypothetical protein
MDYNGNVVKKTNSISVSKRLVMAILQEDVEEVRSLLSDGADPLWQCVDIIFDIVPLEVLKRYVNDMTLWAQHDLSPIIFAVMTGNCEIVRLLISKINSREERVYYFDVRRGSRLFNLATLARKIDLVCAMIREELGVPRYVFTCFLDYHSLLSRCLCDKIINAISHDSSRRDADKIREAIEKMNNRRTRNMLFDQNLSWNSIRILCEHGLNVTQILETAIHKRRTDIVESILELKRYDGEFNDYFYGSVDTYLHMSICEHDERMFSVIFERYAGIMKQKISNGKFDLSKLRIRTIGALFHHKNLDTVDIQTAICSPCDTIFNNIQSFKHYLITASKCSKYDEIEVIKSYLAADPNGVFVYINREGKLFRSKLSNFNPGGDYINHMLFDLQRAFGDYNVNTNVTTQKLGRIVLSMAILTGSQLSCRKIPEINPSNYHTVLPRILVRAVTIMALARCCNESSIYGMPNEILFLIMAAFVCREPIPLLSVEN